MAGVALRKLGVKGVEIRKPEQLQSVKALIIPGGESTTMAKLAEYHNLVCFFLIVSSCRGMEFNAECENLQVSDM